MAKISATRRALVGAVLMGLLTFAFLDETEAAHALRSACSPQEIRDGRCNEHVNGGLGDGSVVLTGEQTGPGRPGSGTSAGTTSTRPPMFGAALLCYLRNQVDSSVCISAAADGIPTITLRDIATFIPTPGRQLMEPDGWTVAGLDTNFFAITGPHVVNGTLLGRPADVQFTPTTYLWAYGDGTSATRYTAGGTWASQGIAEFEPTPTSHVYEQLGDYTITLSIVFTAEYRFAGGSWRPVVGTITLPANDLHLRVGSAKTVLVEHDCVANPSGPGC